MSLAVIAPDEALVGAAITLTNCDREPVHLPSLIQPYGFLLCLDEQTQRVVQASANTDALLDIAADELLGQGLELLLSASQLAAVDVLWPTLTEAARLLGTRLDHVAGQPFYKLVLHRHDGLLWVEGGPVENAAVSAFDLPALNLTLGYLLTADTVLSLCQRAGRLEMVVQATNLNATLVDALDLLQPRLDQTHTTVTVAGTLLMLRCNEVCIQEVFNNLLTNAMRHNDQPHKRVVVGLVPANARGPKGTGSSAEFYVFSVQDNCIGIAPRHHDNIFRLFKRLHAPEKYGGGTGAGLAIARKMVEKHGGELWVESDAGQGATFLFSLSKDL